MSDITRLREEHWEPQQGILYPELLPSQLPGACGLRGLLSSPGASWRHRAGGTRYRNKTCMPQAQPQTNTFCTLSRSGKGTSSAGKLLQHQLQLSPIDTRGPAEPQHPTAREGPPEEPSWRQGKGILPLPFEEEELNPLASVLPFAPF